MHLKLLFCAPGQLLTFSTNTLLKLLAKLMKKGLIIEHNQVLEVNY